MRVVFMGTPTFAVPALLALVEAGHEVVAAYTQPPRPAGRGKRRMPSPVQREAERLGIEVRSPRTLRDLEAQADFAALEAEIAVVAAYGLILPQPVLAAPKHGCINIHASLLPRWRGAAPIHRAVLAGDPVTGVTIMQMEAGLDTGPMLAACKTDILYSDNTGILTHRLSLLGAELVVKVLSDLQGFPPIQQPDTGVTYAKKIEKAEARLDFSQGCAGVLRQIRGFSPTPGAFFEHADERFKIISADRLAMDGSLPSTFEFSAAPGVVIGNDLAIGCVDGAIRPNIIQRAGKPAMSIWDMLRGRTIPAGTQLT